MKHQSSKKVDMRTHVLVCSKLIFTDHSQSLKPIVGEVSQVTKLIIMVSGHFGINLPGDGYCVQVMLLLCLNRQS